MSQFNKYIKIAQEMINEGKKTNNEGKKTNNKVEWTIEDNRQLTWKIANNYANNEGEGWRLPTLEELENAYNENKDFFAHGTYWTSTEDTAFVCGADDAKKFQKFYDPNKCFVRLIKSDNQTLETPLITLT